VNSFFYQGVQIQDRPDKPGTSPDFFAAKFFFAGFFPARNLKIPKFFGANVGKNGVSSVTNSPYRRKSCNTNPAPESENLHFFWP